MRADEEEEDDSINAYKGIDNGNEAAAQEGIQVDEDIEAEMNVAAGEKIEVEEDTKGDEDAQAVGESNTDTEQEDTHEEKVISPMPATTTHRGRRFSSPILSSSTHAIQVEGSAEGEEGTSATDATSATKKSIVFPTPPKHAASSPPSTDEEKQEEKSTIALLLKAEETKLWAAIDSALKIYVRAVKKIRTEHPGDEDFEVGGQGMGAATEGKLLEFLEEAKK
mmetsp:Transcript_14562/g.29883  ORF Transcript_14562/g.29883 Transcript_14562/m.29883 type:complete len:223 (+) Transcript_14562:133-801(+)